MYSLPFETVNSTFPSGDITTSGLISFNLFTISALTSASDPDALIFLNTSFCLPKSIFTLLPPGRFTVPLT